MSNFKNYQMVVKTYIPKLAAKEIRRILFPSATTSYLPSTCSALSTGVILATHLQFIPIHFSADTR